MTEPQQRGRRYGMINGEPIPFVSSTIDEVSGRVEISLVQRGSRTVERLQAAMQERQIRIQMPGSDSPIEAVPRSIDVTSAGSGQQALYRVTLELCLGSAETTTDRNAEQVHIEAAGSSEAGKSAQDLNSRLDGIEAKLDRILTLLEHATKTPSDAC